MVFGKKSKARRPARGPGRGGGRPADGELDLRGLGRALWQRKAQILGVTLFCAAAAFAGGQCDHAAIPLRIAPAARRRTKMCSCARMPTRMSDPSTIDQEAVTSQIQVVLSRDLAREVIKKTNLADNPEFDPRRPPVAAAHAARPHRHRPRPERHDEGRADAGSLLRPSQRLCDRKIAGDRDRFFFGRSRPRRQCRQCGGRQLSAAAADRQAGSDARRRHLARRRNRQDAQQGRRRRSQGRGNIAPSPICSSAPTIPRCRTSSSATSMRRSRPRAARRPIWRRGRGQLRDAHQLGQADRIPPTSPIRN